MRTRLTAVLAALLVLALGTVGTATAAPGGGRTDVIVVLHDGENPDRAAADARTNHGAEVSFVYRHALEGFAASVPDGRLRALANDPRVDYVEVDRTVSIVAQTVPTGIDRIFATSNAAIGIDGADDLRVDAGVAIIDTGIDLEHPDLNVVAGVNCATGGPFGGSCKSGGDDDHYHGTHVAGTVGALDNGDGVVGVAPGARLYAVKVLNSRGSGYTSWIVAGIDWVAARADEIDVANMSLGGAGFSRAEYDAIERATAAGVAFAVAAGNEDDDARNYSPGGFDNVLSVSALADFNGAAGGGAPATCRADVDDTLADFSNWGPAVDIAAPGVCIASTYPLEQGGYGTISGTSMASPHVAGALALLASKDHPANAADVATLFTQVTSSGNSDWTDDGGATNTGDGAKEPLLDVSGTVFAPATVTGGGGSTGGGGGEEPPGNGISLSANPYKVRGVQHVDLAWSGATSDNVDVFRDGARIATSTANDGSYTDAIGTKGGGSYTYRVCQAGTSTCSSDVTATF